MSHVSYPNFGDKITSTNSVLNVPNNPRIPYITGDGIGIDITPVMMRVVDAAVKAAYGDEKKIAWFEVYAGEVGAEKYGDLLAWLEGPRALEAAAAGLGGARQDV